MKSLQRRFLSESNTLQTDHNTVGVITFVRSDLSTNRHTFNTEIEIRTDSTFDPDLASDVFLTIIAVVLPSSLRTLNWTLHKKTNDFE